MYALVDCNSFYASCEKLFRPDLRDRPVVVLSGQEGCVVACSAEAKALGIQIGVPVFQISALIQAEGVVCFAANFALYADLSQRVMATLEAHAPEVEIYSIDEAFVHLQGLTAPWQAIGQQLRAKVAQWTGIRTCVGIAPTRTLAKLANYAAKRYPATQGVVDLSAPERQRRLLALLPVRAVWGVGRQLAAQLESQGKISALDLADSDPAWIRKHFSLTLERTVRELRGQSCLRLRQVHSAKQQLICSRSFSERITDFTRLREAISLFTTRAARKLRQEERLAKKITVFIRTSPHQAGYYANSATLDLLEPSADTRRLIEMAHQVLKSIWKPGPRYMKAGVILSDFYAPGCWQPSLLEDIPRKPQSAKLMQVLDQLHQRGVGEVFFAAQGVRGVGTRQSALQSPAYTTRWSDLPRVS
ncbi:translesion error-prone DNA polymerase V subunit UmuC [Marinospirillum sp. MEB164]|uniref:Translesion error-prone DNA polymerase V subunit UmuC n=1 Tax=Marinospirillum alkalitolerans TaxID=3123374 RepID=A0ABW8PY49_9GAMM